MVRITKSDLKPVGEVMELCEINSIEDHSIDRHGRTPKGLNYEPWTREQWREWAKRPVKQNPIIYLGR